MIWWFWFPQHPFSRSLDKGNKSQYKWCSGQNQGDTRPGYLFCTCAIFVTWWAYQNLVQFLNSPYFPTPYIGLNPGSWKEESRNAQNAAIYFPQIEGKSYLELLSTFGMQHDFLNDGWHFRKFFWKQWCLPLSEQLDAIYAVVTGRVCKGSFWIWEIGVFLYHFVCVQLPLPV